LWFKETENSENNEENTQQTYSANAAATNATEISSNDTTTQDQLQSVAARSVLEIGYTKEQVLDALRKINELRPGMSFSCFHHISISSRNIRDT
jgi:Holliday junction resolvasome RuvABC DNA-binding subunit